ncbi:MAG: glutamine amidotransferase [Candidatus Firestonebacteria bacterium]
MAFEFSLIALLAVAVAAASFALTWSQAERKRLVLLVLRSAAYLIILFVIVRPALVKNESVTGKTMLAVLCDTSKSMGLKEPVDKTALLKKTLKDMLGPIKKNYGLEFYSFAGSAQKVREQELLQAEFNGEITDLAGAILQVKEDFEREKPGQEAGIIIISDGNHNASSDALSAAAEAGLQVYTVGTGAARSGFDLEVAEATVSDIAFRNIETTVTARVRGINAKGIKAYVVLKEGATVLAEKTAEIGDDGADTDVVFSFTPKETGLIKYSVAIAPLKGESSTENNSKEFAVSVLKDKVRILYISGYPNPEYRFLRQVLKTNPNYEVVSFIMLREAQDLAFFPENSMTLIPFPATELFARDLSGFDVVILESFAYAGNGLPPEYLANLASFVEKQGGAFVMIGGEDSFGRGYYKSTAIDALLPVEMKGPDETFSPGFFKMKPEEHPLNRIAYTKEESEAAWEAMPELEGCNVLLRAKPGSFVLGRHPTIKGTDGELIPIIAAWQKGKGRVLSVATNTTWRWSMELAGNGTGTQYYSKYWQGLFNWLTNAPDVKQVRATSDKKVYLKGEQIKAACLALDEYYRPEDSAVVNLSVTEPSGKKSVISNLAFSGSGAYECGVEAKEAGKYVLEASAFKGGKELGRDSIVVEAFASSNEEKGRFLNEKLLKSLAEKTGGAYINAGSNSALKIKIRPAMHSTVVRSRKEAWDSPIFLLLAVLLLAADWYIRRTSGML